MYTHHSRIAQRFTVGWVCLVGNAAHLMPPWAGQGLNTGIRDATNVAWKIAAVVTKGADPGILASYDAARSRIPARQNMVTMRDGIRSRPTSTCQAAPRDRSRRGRHTALARPGAG